MMDDRQFDDLTRMLVQTTTRRLTRDARRGVVAARTIDIAGPTTRRCRPNTGARK
jgi:hypothetical protein